MAGLFHRLVERTLENPLLFELQQKLFNNYVAVRTEFGDHLGRDNLRILDIGCSTGTCGGQIVDMAANAYTGVDVSAKYIDIARRHHPRGRFIQMDARRMAFDDASFDVALFVGVLHHMDDRLARDCLMETRRVVEPGGRLLVAEPVFTPGNALSNLLLTLDRGRHIRDAAGYCALFDGFVVERQRYFRFSLHRFCSYVLSPPSAEGAKGTAA